VSVTGLPSNDKQQRSLITPEGVDLRLQIADGGQRAGAFIVDAVILFGSLALATLVAIIGAMRMGKEARELVEVIWQLGYFVASNGYFIAFELGPRAATPGKRIFGLRVAARNGGRLTADAIFARNAMRQLEVMIPLQVLVVGALVKQSGEPLMAWMFLLAFIWAGIFAFFPLFNRDRLRAGDLVAGTWVVRAPRHKLIADLADDGAEQLARYAFTREQLEAYGVKELHVLEEVLRKGDRKTMRAVSERIRKKIGWHGEPGAFDRDFLAAYYAALRQRLEQRLLFGHRRADKFDKA
jgi:uncharacterized RDD family membrane protein YckC